PCCCGGVGRCCRNATCGQPGSGYTDTCDVDADVNGARVESAQRCSSSSPARRAMRSIPPGHTYRNGENPTCALPSVPKRTWCDTPRCVETSSTSTPR